MLCCSDGTTAGTVTGQCVSTQGSSCFHFLLHEPCEWQLIFLIWWHHVNLVFFSWPFLSGHHMASGFTSGEGVSRPDGWPMVLTMHDSPLSTGFHRRRLDLTSREMLCKSSLFLCMMFFTVRLDSHSSPFCIVLCSTMTILEQWFCMASQFSSPWCSPQPSCTFFMNQMMHFWSKSACSWFFV